MRVHVPSAHRPKAMVLAQSAMASATVSCSAACHSRRCPPMAALRDDLDLMLQAASTTLRSSHSKQLHRRATAPALPIFLGPTRTTERASRAAGGSRSGCQSLCGSLFLDCLHKNVTTCHMPAGRPNLHPASWLLHASKRQASQLNAVCTLEEIHNMPCQRPFLPGARKWAHAQLEGGVGAVTELGAMEVTADSRPTGCFGANVRASAVVCCPQPAEMPSHTFCSGRTDAHPQCGPLHAHASRTGRSPCIHICLFLYLNNDKESQPSTKAALCLHFL